MEIERRLAEKEAKRAQQKEKGRPTLQQVKNNASNPFDDEDIGVYVMESFRRKPSIRIPSDPDLDDFDSSPDFSDQRKKDPLERAIPSESN
eukprot:13516797-Ditylum_brightwellii.AAC.1